MVRKTAQVDSDLYDEAASDPHLQGYAPRAIVAQLMRHATVEMAFRYTHATEHGKRAAVEAARIARPGVCHNPATNDQRPVLLAAVSG